MASPAAQRPTTRWVLRCGAVLAAVVLLGLTWATHPRPDTHAVIDLHLDGVARTPEGIIPLAPGAAATFQPGSRVPQPAESDSPGRRQALADLAAEDRRWLSQGTIPGDGTQFGDLAEAALLDLRALLSDDGALVAAAFPRWEYAWPRDNSFAAVAFARTGHVAEAEAVLGFLARAQNSDGSFEARYTLDGAGAPDDRPAQTDGTGWVLWSLGQVVTDIDDPGEARRVVTELQSMLDAATAHALRLIDNDLHLPPPSPDYWETNERTLTLGTAAPLLAGLEAARDLYLLLDDDASSARAARGAAQLRTAIEQRFGAKGFPRNITGGASDTATAFVLPPFVETPLAGAVTAWQGSVAGMSRQGGGLAPGGSWKRDGISWTPETSLYAMTAAYQGDRLAATQWLAWINAHRTASGAIPEKVLWDGRPAAVAPLAWSCANVLIALSELGN